ncbi:hypothetical protein GGR06_003614 [Bacteroides reticulotermitis]|uniref:Uncharacterized protein n=1 Tax=Bacteroides reticulotermitis TaxID=1133319 RepID=A0A840DBN6_9BACE|nr:hypothetical protein [Bacteroides reticulotermitis]
MHLNTANIHLLSNHKTFSFSTSFIVTLIYTLIMLQHDLEFHSKILSFYHNDHNLFFTNLRI